MALPNVVDSSTQELLDAQTDIWNHIYNFINSMSLKCAIELGIPDVIHKHGKPMTLSDLADALTQIRGDLPHVVDAMEGFENLSFVWGDMFESIPRADAVFLKWILHDWPNEASIKLLKKCKEAIIPNGGKVIIVDMVVDDQKENKCATETQFFMDMLMMTVTTGKERTQKEWPTSFTILGLKLTRLLRF